VLGTIAAAAGVFAGTDVDDLIVLTVLFLAGRATGRPRTRDVVVGQYLGIAALVAISAAAAVGLLAVPDRWVGLIGLVPIAIGIRGLWKARGDDTEQQVVATGALSVAAVTIANGADNLSVYIPLFRDFGLGDTVVSIATFAVMVAVWLAAGFWLGTRRRIVETLDRFGRWLVPVVFIGIGVLLIARSGAIGIFARFD
jgi:cadmium resistance transport/sequestration family protein